VRRADPLDCWAAERRSRIYLEPRRRAACKVVIDYSNGAAGQLLPRVLQEMNCDVIPLNASLAEIVAEEADEAFRQHLQEIGVIVSAVGAKLGVFIDRPGERCFLIDEAGKVMSHDEAFAVLAQLGLAGRSGVLFGPAP